MSTSYDYVRRNTEQQIDWSKVGQDLNQTLEQEQQSRADKKAAIDEGSREYQKRLSEVPLGENTMLNEFALNAAADLQEVAYMNNKLLKSGKLKPRDYTILMQNLNDGTNEAFSLFDDYNQEYSRKMAMLDPNLPISEQASEIQTWSMGLIEGFGNFSETKLVVDPSTGMMSMAKMIEDPKNPEGPKVPDMENLMSVQNMKNRLKSTYTKYDVMSAVDGYAESLGEEIQTLVDLGSYSKRGSITEILDITKKEGFGEFSQEEKDAISMYERAEQRWISSQLDIGGMSSASVLIDFRKINPETGEVFEPTLSEAEAKSDSNKILMRNVNGQLEPELTPAQQKLAETTLKEQLRLQLDRKEEVKSTFQNKRPTPVRDSGGSGGRGDKQVDPELEPLIDTYRRILVTDYSAPKEKDLITINNEDQTKSDVQTYMKSLPGLEGYKITTPDDFWGTDNIVIRNPDREEVLRLTFDKESDYDYEDFIKKLHELSVAEISQDEDRLNLYTEGKRNPVGATQENKETQKRSIAQIMSEDGISRAEAIKIFKTQ